MTIHVDDLKLLDVFKASPDIREADQHECFAGTGLGVASYMASVWPLLAHKRVARDENGEVLCAWGVDPGETGVGHVWLFATNAAVIKAAAIHRHLKREFGVILGMYPRLECWADSRNVKHHEWLRWLGFKEKGEAPFGLMGLPFKHFTRGSEDLNPTRG